jgi:hypothetical protein
MKLLQTQHLPPDLGDPGKRDPLPLAQEELLNIDAGSRRNETQVILREYALDQADRKKAGLQAVQRVPSLHESLRPTLRRG